MRGALVVSLAEAVPDPTAGVERKSPIVSTAVDEK
jgi:hypothetical protein